MWPVTVKILALYKESLPAPASEFDLLFPANLQIIGFSTNLDCRPQAERVSIKPCFLPFLLLNGPSLTQD